MGTDITKASQCKEILDYLKQGNGITQLEALQKFGCGRLSARIWDLRNSGHEIKTRMAAVRNRNGKKCYVAEYRLNNG